MSWFCVLRLSFSRSSFLLLLSPFLLPTSSPSSPLTLPSFLSLSLSAAPLAPTDRLARRHIRQSCCKCVRVGLCVSFRLPWVAAACAPPAPLLLPSSRERPSSACLLRPTSFTHSHQNERRDVLTDRERERHGQREASDQIFSAAAGLLSPSLAPAVDPFNLRYSSPCASLHAV